MALRCGVVILLAAGLALAQAPLQPTPASPTATAAAHSYRPRVLIVVAHPDDESCFAATVYEITHNLGGVVDQLVITNGEGGYRYSLLADSYYGVALTDEAVGRAALPEIRKRELLEAGRILGVANHFFLDQRDVRYTLDIDEVLNRHWQPDVVLPAVERRIDEGHYDFIFTLFPSPETHGAHKAAAITALNAVEQMKDAEPKPVVLGCQTASSAAHEPSWKGFENPLHPFQVVLDVFVTDRNVKFGFNNALNYQIVVNWEIAAHKSQGLFQEAMNRADREEFVILESGRPEPSAKGSTDKHAEPSATDRVAEQAARVRQLFHALAGQAAHPGDVARCAQESCAQPSSAQH